MSIAASMHVWKTSNASGSARVLMLAIANFADDDGKAWPSRATLAAFVNVSERQITDLVQECERLGELGVVSERGRSNTYHILGMAGTVEHVRPPRQKRERQRPTGEAGRTTAAGRTSAAPRTRTSAAGRTSPPAARRSTPVQPAAPEPSFNRHRNDQHDPSDSSLATAPAPRPNVYAKYERWFGPLDQRAADYLLMLVNDFGDDEVTAALEIAAKRDKRDLKYTLGILNNRAAAGRAPARQRYEPPPRPAPPVDTVLVWPPPDLHDELAPDDSPAQLAWSSICQQLPQLDRFLRAASAETLAGSVLTVRVADPRTHAVLTQSQRIVLDHAARDVLGQDAVIRVELVQQAGAA